MTSFPIFCKFARILNFGQAVIWIYNYLSSDIEEITVSFT